MNAVSPSRRITAAGSAWSFCIRTTVFKRRGAPKIRARGRKNEPVDGERRTGYPYLLGQENIFALISNHPDLVLAHAGTENRRSCRFCVSKAAFPSTRIGVVFMPLTAQSKVHSTKKPPEHARRLLIHKRIILFSLYTTRSGGA
jgi:hypothetical protein